MEHRIIILFYIRKSKMTKDNQIHQQFPEDCQYLHKKRLVAERFNRVLMAITGYLPAGRKQRLSQESPLPVAMAVIEKYRDNPVCIQSDRVLPILSNQKMNPYLKVSSMNA